MHLQLQHTMLQLVYVRLKGLGTTLCGRCVVHGLRVIRFQQAIFLPGSRLHMSQ